MQAWRIYDHKAAWAQQPHFNPLDGNGGLYGAARWHHKGHPIIYAAASPSLALLEALVHVRPDEFGEQTLLELHISGDHHRVTRTHMLQLLRSSPPEKPEDATREYGSKWLSERKHLTLIAPSIVMPFENNIILNPRHPGMDGVEILNKEIITLDYRLLHQFHP